MTNEDIERLKDICAKEGFDLMNQDGRYYIEQARNRVIDAELYHIDRNGYTIFRFLMSDKNKLLEEKENLQGFLIAQLEKYLNNEIHFGEFDYDNSENKMTVLNLTGNGIEGGLAVKIKGYDPNTGLPIVEPVNPVDSAQFVTYPKNTNTTL